MMKAVVAVLATAACAPGAFARCHHRPSSSSAAPSSVASSTLSSSALPSSSVLSSILSSSASSVSSSIASSSVVLVPSSVPSPIASSSVASSSVASSSSAPSSEPTAFTCDGSSYVIQDNSLSRLDLLSGDVALISANLGGISTDALAYNHFDNLLYATQQSINDQGDPIRSVIRINPQGEVTVIADAQFPGNMGTIAGDGLYWTSFNGQNYMRTVVDPSSSDYGTVLPPEDTSLLFINPQDWAYHPFGGEGHLWTIVTDGTFHDPPEVRLLRFDASSGAWSDVRGYSGAPPAVNWGAMFAFADEDAIYATTDEGQTWKFPLGMIGEMSFFGPFPHDPSPKDGASCVLGSYKLPIPF